MALENEEALSVLSQVQPKGVVDTTVEDINAFVPEDLSPAQRQAFSSQFTPVTGQFSNSTYYPDLGHNVNVGSYYGSEIGSTTLFAPGGGVLPLGLMDARDAAIQRAALQKAKEIEDFNKRHQAPTTKHVAVQKNLTDKYFEGLQQWNQNALKKAGGDQATAARMLESDPRFNAWNKSMQDLAKFHNAIVEHGAELNAAENDPNFVLSPETRKSWQNIQSGVSYLDQSPFSQQGQKIGTDFLSTRALYDLDKSVNTAIDKAIPDIEQLPVNYTQRGKNETATYLEKEYFKPERVEDIAKNIYMEKYQGTDIPYESVKKKVDAMLGEKIRRKTDTYDKWFKPDNSGSPAYDENAVVSESAENVVSKGKVVNSYTERFVPTNAVDQKKDLKFSISKDMVSADGSPITNKTGYVEGSVQGIGVKPYYKKEKRFLTDEEVKVLKDRGVYETTDDLEMKPAVVFNVKEEKDARGKEQQKTIYFDTEKIAGVFKNSKKSGKDYEDMRQMVESHASELNKNRKPTAAKKDWSKYKR